MSFQLDGPNQALQAVTLFDNSSNCIPRVLRGEEMIWDCIVDLRFDKLGA
ncbi:MAG TPA: hypothetical protein VKE30_04855 [Chthoniobacterales bacterium]|nr:hypothetical protein [Chthoniobacterales bacterium]